MLCLWAAQRLKCCAYSLMILPLLPLLLSRAERSQVRAAAMRLTAPRTTQRRRFCAERAAHKRQEQDTRKIPPCFCSRLPVFAIDFRAGTKPVAGFGCGKIPFGRAALSRAAGTDGRATMGICGRSAAVRFRFAAAQPDLLRPQDKKCRRAKKQTHFLTNIHK